MKDKIIYKELVHDDIEMLLGLIHDFYLHEGIEFSADHSRKALQKILSNDLFGNIWLITLEGKTIGYVALTYAFSLEFGGRNALLDEIYIEEKYRGKGIGSEVLNFVFKQCRLKDVHAVHLQVLNFNEKAKRLYERNGFEVVDRMFMTKVLD